MTLVALVSIVAGGGCKDSAWSPMGSAEFVLSEIRLGGADKVSRRIDADENFGRSVMNGISTGDSLWLEVAAELTPASAAAESSLSIALSSALTQSPARVLPLLGDRYPVDEVCGMPFLKADSSQVITYHAAAIAALQRVRARSLVAKRDSCRTALDTARDRRLDRINPAYLVKNKPVVPPRRIRKKTAKQAPAIKRPDSTAVTRPDSSSSD